MDPFTATGALVGTGVAVETISQGLARCFNEESKAMSDGGSSLNGSMSTHGLWTTLENFMFKRVAHNDLFDDKTKDNLMRVLTFNKN